MRRSPHAGAISCTGFRPAGIAVLLVALLAACGSSSTTSSTHRSGSGGVSVAPATASSSSQVTFSFTPSQSGGVHGHQALYYVVSVSGPHGTGCVSSRGGTPPSAVQGRVARVVLGPAQTGGKWCRGSYTARAQELAKAACKPGQMCPMYVRLVGTVGTVTFKVAGG